MTRKADTLRPFLRCAAVVLCSLALPLAVFALWDRALLAAPHIRTDGERFSAAGRANATACTLYAAEHVTKVPLGSNSLWDGGWTAGTMDGSALARARRTLRALHEAGLLCDDSYAAALSVCRLDYGSWELYTAPCGLTQLVRRPEEIYTGADTEHVYIQLILSDDDAPLYFNYQNDLGQGDTLANDAVAQYCALLGLDEFTDWQYPDWGTAVRDFGAAGYSETAQVYAVANASGYSVTLSAASMTPQTFPSWAAIHFSCFGAPNPIQMKSGFVSLICFTTASSSSSVSGRNGGEYIPTIFSFGYFSRSLCSSACSVFSVLP